MRAVFLGGARGSSRFAAQVPGAAGIAEVSLPFFAFAPVRMPVIVMLCFMLLQNRITACQQAVCKACVRGLLCC